MSTEKGAAKQSLSSEGTITGTNTANLEQQQQQQHPQQQQQQPISTESTNQQQPKDESTNQQQPKDEATTAAASSEQSARSDPKSGRAEAPTVASGAPVAEGSAPTGAASTTTADSGDPPRQVIAVSASKSPAAFFNLARKFLVTNEMCDLSALEGAIVSAVDAAHLLERSQLATIVRIHTSYVSVEPKRKKQSSPQGEQDVVLVQPSPTVPAGVGVGGEVTVATAATTASTEAAASSASSTAASAGTASPQPSRRGSTGGRELRRARIVVTVRRTESYKRWLEENPLQAIIANEADEEGAEATGTQASAGSAKRP